MCGEGGEWKRGRGGEQPQNSPSRGAEPPLVSLSAVWCFNSSLTSSTTNGVSRIKELRRKRALTTPRVARRMISGGMQCQRKAEQKNVHSNFTVQDENNFGS